MEELLMKLLISLCVIVGIIFVPIGIGVVIGHMGKGGDKR